LIITISMCKSYILVGIKCMIDLLVTKVTKSIRLFNFKLMIISTTHRIMMLNYMIIGLWVH